MTNLRLAFERIAVLGSELHQVQKTAESMFERIGRTNPRIASATMDEIGGSGSLWHKAVIIVGAAAEVALEHGRNYRRAIGLDFAPHNEPDHVYF